MSEHTLVDMIECLRCKIALEYRALGRYVSETPQDTATYATVVGFYISDIEGYKADIDKLMEVSR